MDMTASGLWGGMFVLITGVVIIKRFEIKKIKIRIFLKYHIHKYRANVLVLVFSILSAMSGIIMMALYIWSFTLYGDKISAGYTCSGTFYMGHSICKNG